MATPVEWAIIIGAAFTVGSGIYGIIKGEQDRENAEEFADDQLETQEEQAHEAYLQAVEEITEHSRLQTESVETHREDQVFNLKDQYSEIAAAQTVYAALSGVGGDSVGDRKTGLDSELKRNQGIIERDYEQNLDVIETQKRLNLEKAQLGLEHNLENAQLNWQATQLQIPSTAEIVTSGVFNMGSDLLNLGFTYFNLTGGPSAGYQSPYSNPGTWNYAYTL